MYSFFNTATKPQNQLDSDNVEIYFNLIESYQPLDVGTKVLYLERAISEDCYTFLESLDRVYDPSLTGQAKQNNLNFIHALKLINDYYLNNSDTVLAQMIKDKINLLNNEVIDIAKLKAAREKAESRMLDQCYWPTGGWRVELNLPADQVSAYDKSRAKDTSCVLGGVISPEECLTLSAGVRNVICRSPVRARDLIRFGLTLSQLQKETDETLAELIKQSIDIQYLRDNTYHSMSKFFELDPKVRSLLAAHSTEVIRLQNSAYLTMSRLATLDQHVLLEVIKHPNAFCMLVSASVGFKLDDLLELKSDRFSELLNNSIVVVDLVTKQSIPVNHLLALSREELQTVFKDSNSEESQRILNPPKSGLTL
jgi:hypothetical protein